MKKSCEPCKNVNNVKQFTEGSKFLQVDGNMSIQTETTVSETEITEDDLDDTDYDTDDEAFPVVTPANLVPVDVQSFNQELPRKFDVNLDTDMSSSLPLCLLLNSRSVYNKSDNLKEMLHQIGPDLCLISETFERERKRLSTVLGKGLYKSISCYRKNRAPWGGCAILYNENRFSVLDLEIPSMVEVENVWGLITPKQAGQSFGSALNFKRIAVGSYYVSPKSRYKRETIKHIIYTIHTLRAKYDN